MRKDEGWTYERRHSRSCGKRKQACRLTFRFGRFLRGPMLPSSRRDRRLYLTKSGGILLTRTMQFVLQGTENIVVAQSHFSN